MRYRTLTAQLHYTDAQTGERIPAKKIPAARLDRGFTDTYDLFYCVTSINQDLDTLRERCPGYCITPLWFIDDTPLDAFTVTRKR